MSRTPQYSRALIVGGTGRSIGFAAAQALATSGETDRFVLVGRNRDRGEASAQQLRDENGVSAEFLCADLSSAAAAQQVATSATEMLGGVDILVNATSPAFRPDLVHTIDIEDIGPTLTQYALPSMHMCRAVLPVMREQGWGSIVNVASDAAKTPTPGEAVIGAGMAAIVMFTRAVAIEAGRDGIRANVITPSIVGDTMTTDHMLQDGFSKKLFDKAISIAESRLGLATAHDQGELIAFLAGSRSARMTGQALSANGGISAV